MLICIVFLLNQQVERKKYLTDPQIHTSDVDVKISPAVLLYPDSGDYPHHQNTLVSAVAALFDRTFLLNSVFDGSIQSYKSDKVAAGGILSNN